MTHPVQYLAPWFRYISSRCSEIDLTVLYAVQPTPEQQGVGFGKAFVWDVPLTEGYRSKVLRPLHKEGVVHSSSFWGVNVAEIKKAIYDTQPDVVLINGWHSVTQLRALWACREKRIPVLYRGDTHLGNAPDGVMRLLWLAKTRLLLRLFDGYLSVGARAREYLQKFGAHDEQIFNSPHCVDNDFFEMAARPYQFHSGKSAVRKSFGLEDDFVVLFVGKLEPKKHPLDLINAVGRLGKGISLLVVGSGSQEKECRALAQKLGVRAVWAGFLNQSEIGRAYAAADCLALPSDWGETWGLVVNEAMATGLPCVVSNHVGCAPDLIVKSVTGETFSMGDIDALAAALDSIWVQSKSGHCWKSACKTKIAAYSFKEATAGLLSGCNALMHYPVSQIGLNGQQDNALL